jgi:hypothetical protein
LNKSAILQFIVCSFVHHNEKKFESQTVLLSLMI